jgi:hypothetical protein
MTTFQRRRPVEDALSMQVLRGRASLGCAEFEACGRDTVVCARRPATGPGSLRRPPHSTVLPLCNNPSGRACLAALAHGRIGKGDRTLHLQREDENARADLYRWSTRIIGGKSASSERVMSLLFADVEDACVDTGMASGLGKGEL